MISFTVRVILSEQLQLSFVSDIEVEVLAESYSNLLDIMSSAGTKNDQFVVLSQRDVPTYICHCGCVNTFYDECGCAESYECLQYTIMPSI